MHKANGISISKVTHAGRVYAVQNACTNGASKSGTKALGGCSKNGAFHHCYERTWPADAMLGAGGFNGSKPERYCLPRGELRECLLHSYVLVSTDVSCSEPPESVLSCLWPQVEHELLALEQRVAQDSRQRDYALQLIFLCTILVQDAALLYAQDPSYALWDFTPFNMPEFRAFAVSAPAIVLGAEERTRAAFQNLPEQYAASVRGVTTNFFLEQQLHHSVLDTRLDRLEASLHVLQESMAHSSRWSASRTSARGRAKGTCCSNVGHPLLC